jgi:glycine/D-amino acid oxidase-like deaminating enzyme
VRAWYRHGDDDASMLPALRAVLADLLPGIRVRSWRTRRCADAYTAHYHPYIGTLAPGIVAVLGGNGRGAQAADAVGHLAARIALTGEWESDLPPGRLLPRSRTRHLERHDPAARRRALTSVVRRWRRDRSR